MKRSAVTVVVALGVLAALLVAGCGGGSSGGSDSTIPGGEAVPPKATAPNAPAGSKVVSCGSDQLRATEVDCATARQTMERWQATDSCALAKDVSRNSCSVGSFRCQAANVGEGISVSCASASGDVAFVVKPGG
jgi:hypothetical protein